MSCHSDTRYRFGELLLEPKSGRLFHGQEELCLAPLSRKLLLALVEHSPAVLSHEDLQREVWDDRYVTAATVKQRVKLLREAIGDDARAPRYIAMDRGIGYRLVPPVTAVAATLRRPTPGPLRIPLSTLRLAALALVLALLLPLRSGAPGLHTPKAASELETPEAGGATAEAAAHYEQAELFYHRRAAGDIDRARSLYLSAIAADPDYAKAWVALAGVYSLQYGQTAQLGYEESLSMQRRALDRALALDPTLGDAHARLALVYQCMGEPQERVRERFETALALAPDDPVVRGLYAHHQFRAGNLEQSLTAMQRAVELDPYSLVHRQNLAIAYVRLNRLGDAERELRQAITIHPSMADLLALTMAHLRILQGRPEDALDLIGKLEDRADQLSVRAMALNDLGDPAASEAALADLAGLPGPYARLRQGEAETYVYQVDATQNTIAAIDEAGTAGPEAFRQAQFAYDESLYSPFLVSIDRFRRDAGRELAAEGSWPPDTDP